MALFITVDDFVGEIAIPKDKFTDGKLQDYLDRFEKNLLINLLGAELYKAFIKDYTDANPDANKFTEARYQAIFDEIILDENDCRLIHSEGMKAMLLYLIYFYYIREINYTLSLGGAASNNQVDGTQAPFQVTNINDIYNKGVTTWNWIQYYIDCYNPENYDYNNFNGRVKNYNSLV